MSLVGLAIHIGLLALTVAIIIPAGLTLFALLLLEVSATPDNPEENNNDE